MIAFSHYSAAGDISGVTTWFEKLILRLHLDGVPVVVLLHHFGKQVEDSSLLPQLRNKGVLVEIVPRARTLSQDVDSTLDFLNRHRPSAYFPHCLPSLNLAAVAAGRAGLRWALTVHSDDPVYWAMAKGFSPDEHGGELVCVSHYLANSTQQSGLAKYPILIPYGVTRADRRANFSDQPFRVGFRGRVIEEQKRISLVIEAMGIACRNDESIQGVIIGDGPAMTHSRARVAQLGLSNRIQFLGRLSQGDVAKELSVCQALLLMSDYEGLPIALLEAMSIGVVPIVRKIPSGIPELVETDVTGLLVDDSPDGAAEAVLRLRNDPQGWARISHAARALVESDYDENLSYQSWRSLTERLSTESRVRYPLSFGARDLPASNYPIFQEAYPTLRKNLKRLAARLVNRVRRVNQ